VECPTWDTLCPFLKVKGGISVTFNFGVINDTELSGNIATMLTGGKAYPQGKQKVPRHGTILDNLMVN